jgi:hypothetical protein
MTLYGLTKLPDVEARLERPEKSLQTRTEQRWRPGAELLERSAGRADVPQLLHAMSAVIDAAGGIAEG